MRAWSWFVVAVLGFGAMLAAYSTRPRPLAGSPFAHGFLFIGPEASKDARPPGQVVPARVRLLPGDDRAESLLKVMERVMPDNAQRLRWQLRRKLIVLPLSEAGIDAESLQAGRLPVVGRDEALAGAGSARQDRVAVGGRICGRGRRAQGRGLPPRRLLPRPVLRVRPTASYRAAIPPSTTRRSSA